MTSGTPVRWSAARAAAHAAGRAARPDPTRVSLSEADGLVLAEEVRSRTDLPAFATSSVDGYAVRGAGPWRLTGRVLAGSTPSPLTAATAVEIATGAMVPTRTTHILRLEESTIDDGGLVHGVPRPMAQWRERGEEARAGDLLCPAGTVVTPAAIGLAAAGGADDLTVIAAPRVATIVFGDELLDRGVSDAGKIRDALGPQLPGWLRRLGAIVAAGPIGPVEDTLDAHIHAIRAGLAHADVVCTTGGTMRGPVDHLHDALDALGAERIVDTVAVRPGYPMLLARLNRPETTGEHVPQRPAFVVGLPGNPLSALVAMVTLVQPLLRGLAGRPEPSLSQARLADAVAPLANFTRLVPVHPEPDGSTRPTPHIGSAMLRGVARARGFVVIEPETSGTAGSVVSLVVLPIGPNGAWPQTADGQWR